ncbi:hypothetical protein [Leptolyngbya sp. FACHB-36]|nr:hypothetical protein [Leptolyngbya sp. FACHB-36]
MKKIRHSRDVDALLIELSDEAIAPPTNARCIGPQTASSSSLLAD